MSALREAAPPARPAPRSAARRGPAPPPAAESPSRDSLALRLVAFAALAAFATGHWAGLLSDASPRATWGTLLVVLAGAGALAWLHRAVARLAAARALAAATALLTFLLALVATGLSARLLTPGGLPELADGLERGLAGVRTADWPYQGGDGWVSLTIALGAPWMLSLAAGLAFWPARRAAPVLRALALVSLLVLYGTAVTEHDPGDPLLRGFLLLLLVGAWLWLPRLALREAASGAAVVAAVGLLSLPVATALDGERPWWDYRAWDWFGGGRTVAFDWNHSYGPLDWPRDGTTLLNVKSRQAHYWKAETLDRFDGYRWLRSPGVDGTRALSELPDRLVAQGRKWDYFEFNPRWDRRLTFTVRSLRSDFVVGAGTTYAVRGAGTTISTADGTTLSVEEPLERGETYRVRAYVPDPSAAQMRGTPSGYPPAMEQYTTLFLPQPGATSTPGDAPTVGGVRPAGRPAPPVGVPLRGDRLTGDSGAAGRLLSSPYGRVYRLARRLTAGSATAFDAVQRVERHLRRSYRYSERPPARDYPLAAFLFRDRIGYCQQFSGAMALMLRMVGIPSRVVSGFSPGSFNRDEGEYRVRDLDAHSWVEVFFNGIGWVTFDPTPPAAPAQQTEDEAPAAGGGDAGAVSELPGRQSDAGQASPGGSGVQARGARVGTLPLLAAGLALAVLVAGGLALRRRRAWLALPPALAAEAQLRELESALRRLGWGVPGGTTLLRLERRLARAGGPAAARYAAALRAHRYSTAGRAPAAGERRRLRRELTAGGGIRARLHGLLAIPPWGPRTG